MRTRITTAVATAALAVTLVGCGGSDDGSSGKPDQSKAAAPKASKSADRSEAEKAAGNPGTPDAAQRAQLIRSLRGIDPALATDEDKAVDNARNQCSTIRSGGNADMTAKARFSTSDHKVTDLEARRINVAVVTALCPN